MGPEGLGRLRDRVGPCGRIGQIAMHHGELMTGLCEQLDRFVDFGRSAFGADYDGGPFGGKAPAIALADFSSASRYESDASFKA